MCCEVDDGLVQHLAHSSPFADTPGVCFHPSTFQADDGNGERDVDDVIVAVLILLGILVISGPILASVALAKVSSLRQRVDRMTRELAALRGADTPSQPAAPVEPAVFDSHVAAPAPSPGSRPAPDLPPQDPPRDFGEPLPRKEPLPPPIPHSVDVQPEQVTTPAPAQVPSEPGVIDTVVTRIKAWFGSGNVPVKVGMLVLLVGVAALLRYASNQGWLNAPIELKLAGICGIAMAALVFAWRKRDSHRTFALAVQGGAIGVLLMVAFAAFKTYHLIDAMPAFAASVVLIAGMAVLAVLQDSRTLAILGTLAGFMAPIWLSDGSGNHVALFSYYAVLNIGIFVIAWLKPWRILNLLGFVFTWGIGSAWGALSYTPDKFASTEPFLLLFFTFYLLIPLLYARKAITPGGARIDGSLLFGTPLIAFSLQAGLLHDDRMSLALCALGIAAIYALLAKLLVGRERLGLLARGYAVLAVGFATLAVPLALSARATASVFALEGAGLVWLGLQQQRRLARWTGLGLQLAAAFAWWLAAGDGIPRDALAIANATCMGALLIALAAFATAWLYRKAEQSTTAALAYLWGLLWWLGNGIEEIGRFVATEHHLHLVLLVFGISGWLAAEVHRRAPARALAWTTLGGLLLGFPMALIQQAELTQPLAGYGSWAWPLFALLGWRSLVCLRESQSALSGIAQTVWWLLWPTVLSLLAWYLADHFALAQGWTGMLLALPWLILATVSLQRWHWLTPPLGAAFDRYRLPLQMLLFTALALWWLVALFDSGDGAPLPWLPLLNPLDLAQAAVLVLLAQWLRDDSAPSSKSFRLGLALAALLLVTTMTLRGVHHWGGLAWNDALLPSGLAQTSLAVVWSLLGVIGWVLGSRRGQWGLWLSGAILMGIVLLKLLLIDRSNLGDLLGIGAFIAYGLLCTLVGWFAPAPPRNTSAPPPVTEPEGATP